MVKQQQPEIRTKKQIGRSLKKVRLQFKMTVKYLSKITQLSRLTIKATEAGLRYPDLVHLIALQQHADLNDVKFSLKEVVYK